MKMHSNRSVIADTVLIASFVVGTIGNLAALWILYKSSKNRNKKHVLLLRWLATNDLVAEVGMLLMIQLHKFQIIPCYWRCVSFVLLRAFGLGSGCVAFVMALERWLALTKPFHYHQIVTFQTLKRFLFCIWFGGFILTCLPLFGFGLYYDYQEGKCSKFRYAKETKDIIYAYLFFVFGTILVICITLLNSMVILELLRIGTTHDRALVRRISRSTINQRNCTKYQTPEEVAFAKLMAIVCVIHVICWAPQVISVPIAQLLPESKFCDIYFKLADLLLCVYFTLDPFVYVLQRYMEKGKFFLPCCFCRRKSSNLTIISTPTIASPTTPTTTTTSGTPTSVLLNPPSFTICKF